MGFFELAFCPQDDYTTIRQIGKGAFGTAHIVQHKVTGERFVLKRVRLARQTARERQSSVKELLLLSNLRHRNVLEFKGCWVEGGCNLCMLVELCESGDLFTQLRLRVSACVRELCMCAWWVELLSALAYLHRSNIAHRDLKTANILITGDGCLKLADFGLSTVLEQESNRMTNTMVGTPNYMSPCVLQEKPYGTPNDIWGLGCVLFELSALKPAYQAFNMAGLIKKVTSGPAPPVPPCYSDHWRNLVRAMLTKEPDMRPSASELLDLDWLQVCVFMYVYVCMGVWV
ncbi:NimA-related protein kinase 9 [Volvox carteri f. nagariensis]|uniref:NimA-related protein kinase 9 n=1 Tax=Volvox carteri f. nagariensis TaxID=3068 RepID=D8UJH0_VOLCA|nr:NimA-related protein kinase 9 [Volvox carteri f. nagariensis]EFJ40120.1 NimA-related protein kinase 9 [Volvox carteri f. nagariensis]|eukprot:XP_002958816.1 NimA-related protein kinase 9 [Volvox carteri f. nagariensis]